jgi:hypothetical protein
MQWTTTAMRRETGSVATASKTGHERHRQCFNAGA